MVSVSTFASHSGSQEKPISWPSISIFTRSKRLVFCSLSYLDRNIPARIAPFHRRTR